MPTIKGPIIFKAGEKIPEKVIEAVGGIKLPFTATSFRCSREKELNLSEFGRKLLAAIQSKTAATAEEEEI